MRARILVVDDEPDHLSVVAGTLEAAGYEVLRAGSAEEALSRAHETPPEVVVTDLRLPGMDGVALLKRLREGLRGEVGVVVMTGHEDMTSAVEAMKAGAFDYVVKPIGVENLVDLVARCAREVRLERELSAGEPEGEGAGEEIVGRDPRMIELFKMIGVLARNRATVLVRGETGTGKELVARAIHRHSAHADEPFIPVNCTALSESLLESELFGHVRGAFTGAVSGRRGYFELAGAGTIFLDEIGDTSLGFQTKLLRVLQDRTFFPVGAESPRRTEARVIAATHQNLEELVEEGGFREDLYFRLRVVELRLPPLRERPGDIPDLVRALLARVRRETGRDVRDVSPEALRLLQARSWPGNVRELENALTRAALLSRGRVIGPEHLEFEVPETGGVVRGATGGEGSAAPVPGVVSGAGGDLSLDAAVAAHVRRVLEHTGGNKSRAARLLGISRSRLARMIARYGLDGPPPGSSA